MQALLGFIPLSNRREEAFSKEKDEPFRRLGSL
jgi:hypothetical protein